ncbi:MAG: hypothetical protein AAF645_07965 [Myxococcota bacterium]
MRSVRNHWCGLAVVFAAACHVPPHAVERWSRSAGPELVVDNATPKLVCYVEARPSDAERGDAPYMHDRLGPGDAIAPGEARHFSLAEGVYEIRLWDCNRNLLYEREAVELGALTVMLSVP